MIRIALATNYNFRQRNIIPFKLQRKLNELENDQDAIKG